MALEMKTECEKCQAPLGKLADAYICSFECSFCSPCSESMHSKCPNCGGELQRRPKREL